MPTATADRASVELDWRLDFFDNQFWVMPRNADAIPDKRKQRVGKPVQPTQTLDLMAVFEMQVHPNVKKFVDAEPGYVVGFETTGSQEFARAVTAVAGERQHGPAAVRDVRGGANLPSLEIHRSGGICLARDDLIQATGTVDKILGGGRYQITLESGQCVTAQLSGRMRRFRIRVIPGDRVQVGVSPYDPTHGFVTFRLREGQNAPR